MKILMVIISFLAMIGCASDSAQRGAGVRHLSSGNVDLVGRSVHFYVEQLTRQLLLTSKSIKLNQTVAVGTFLPISSLGGKNAPPSNLLGQQIQESFVTLATQAGLNVVEFKTSKNIKMQKNQDVMLTRIVDEINTSINADYYLTGNYSSQDKGVLVNVRLIEVATSNVVAAATDLIPGDIVAAVSDVGQTSASAAGNSPYYLAN